MSGNCSLIQESIISAKTAILVFARSAQQDAKHKRFCNAVSVFESLNAQILKTVKQTGLPYFIYSEEKQRGSTFGSRFTQALQEVYNLGYDQVISVGNDTPHLTKEHFAKAEEKLKTCPLVLGPSKDGGFYLMGLKKSHFNPVSFLKLPWQTSALTPCMIRLAQSKHIEIHFLKALQDLDTAADIQAILNSTQKLALQLRIQLNSALKKHQPVQAALCVLFGQNHVGGLFNKGSPISPSA